MIIVVYVENFFKLFVVGKCFLGLFKGIVKVFYLLNLDVRKGEMFGIVGEFGCGKLIFVCMLVGLMEFMIGLIEISGNLF